MSTLRAERRGLGGARATRCSSCSPPSCASTPPTRQATRPPARSCSRTTWPPTASRPSCSASCPIGRTWPPASRARARAPGSSSWATPTSCRPTPAEWSVPPFGGVVKDGYVWGCGATDMKNQVAAEAVAVARLARSGADFAGDVVYLATRRRGGRRRTAASAGCASTAPSVIRCDYLLNEGMGGLWLPIDGAQGLPPRRRREGVRAVPDPDARRRRSRLRAREGAQRRHRPRPRPSWRWVSPTRRRSSRR